MGQENEGEPGMGSMDMGDTQRITRRLKRGNHATKGDQQKEINVNSRTCVKVLISI